MTWMQTWAELAWADRGGPHGGAAREPRIHVYTNTVEMRHWQHHEVSIEGDQLQQLLGARPAPVAAESDNLLLIIRSRFPGWVHYIQTASVSVEWVIPAHFDGWDSP